MRKGTFIATIALLIAIAGAIVAFAAYFKRRSCAIYDDFDEALMDDDMSDLDYYATQVDDMEDDLEEALVEASVNESVAAPDEQAETLSEDPEL